MFDGQFFPGQPVQFEGQARRPFVAETRALLARYGTPPGAARAHLIDTLIAALKTAGVWSKLDALYLFAGHDATDALLNIVENDDNAALISTPTFTTDMGYQGNGTSSAVELSFYPNAASQNYVQDSAYFGVWSRTSAQQSASIAGFFGTNGVTINPRTTGNALSYRINQASADTVGTITDGAGWTSLARSSSSATRASKNGVQIGTGSQASTAPVSSSLRVGSINPGGYNASQFAAAAAGSFLDTTEDLALYDALLAYLQAVGAA